MTLVAPLVPLLLLALSMGGKECEAFHTMGQPWSSSSSSSSVVPLAMVTNQDTTVVTTTPPSATTTSIVSSTQMGSATVDMNQYNLPAEDIPTEWTAHLKAATETNEAGVFLGTQNDKDHFADTVKVVVSVPPPGQGLGIELLELAGGRADGVGITMVSGLVPGKVAESSGLLYGDSIVQLSLRRRTNSNGGGMQELESVAMECLAYDGTIDAIVSILQSPAAQTNDPSQLFLVFTVKRLRRKPKVNMLLQYPPSQGEPDVSLELFSGENLRRALLARGVKLNDPLARRFDNGGTGDCGAEGTCATCAVHVVQGRDLLSPAGDSEAQIVTRRNPRWRMACKAVVGHGMTEGTLVIRVNPKQWVEEEEENV